MITKKTILSIILVLAVLISPILPPAQTTALTEHSQTLTIEDPTLYTALKKCLTQYNSDALQDSDDKNRQMTLDMDRITTIQMQLSLDITGDNFKNTLETLFHECTNLTDLSLVECDLRDIDLSQIDHKKYLTSLVLVKCNLDQVPDLELPNLTTLCLSNNDLSADGACDRLSNGQFPALTCLWLDNCQITDIDFLQYIENLEDLSLADNLLTDDSITALTGMTNLSDLKALNLGVKIHVVLGGLYSYNVYTPSKNTFTDLAGLASLPEYFPKLETLELSGLKITSIEPFTHIINTPQIYFDLNYIIDYTGLTNENKFIFSSQKITFVVDLSEEQECELPEVVKRILDPEDLLYSSGGLTYTNCHLSEDGSKIVMDKNSASLKVNKGKLSGAQIIFREKQLPSYTIPGNLTAFVGKSLSTVTLPEGFSWVDPAQIMEKEGNYTYKAIYTPSDTNLYFVVEDIDVPVMVTTPSTPTPIPTAEPTPTPVPTQAARPSTRPSALPTQTARPSSISSAIPTQTARPSSIPTSTPSALPTQTARPSAIPTQTARPSSTPSALPTQTARPSSIPTEFAKTASPTTASPTPTQTITPTEPAKTIGPVQPAEQTAQENPEREKRDLSINAKLKVTWSGKKINIEWGKIAGADGYDVYVQYCTKKFTKKSITAIKNSKINKVAVSKINGKKLKLKQVSKIYVLAYNQTTDGKKETLAKTITAHVVGPKNTKYTNVKAVKVSKSSYKLKKGSSATIKAKTVMVNKNKKNLTNNHAKKFRYATTNKKVATVSKKGTIKAVGTGSCSIYVYARNGNAKKVTVKVNSGTLLH